MITAVITRDTPIAPADTLTTATVIVPDGMTAIRAIRTTTVATELDGTTETPDIPMITPETIAEGDRSIKD